MSTPKIIMSETRAEEARRSSDPLSTWRLLAVTGFLLILVAGADLALGVYPLDLGNPQWEFGTFSRLFDSLPLLTMATALFMVGASPLGWRVPVKITGAVCVVFGLVLLAALVLYGLTVPLALKSVADPLAASGLKRAIVKTLVQGAVFPTVYFWLGYNGLRKSA
jgi:hypothetical protein